MKSEDFVMTAPPSSHGDVLASLVIKDEGPSPLKKHLRRWSLNLIVHGTFWRIGPLVNGVDVQDAAKQFAIGLWRNE